MATENSYKTGDSAYIMLRKLLTLIGGLALPGDSAAVLLRKVLTLLDAAAAVVDGENASVLLVGNGQPADGTGAAGYISFDPSDLSFYLNVGGTWTWLGNLYTPEAVTRQLLSNYGAPAAQVGNDNDVYLDSNSLAVYQKAGAWNQIGEVYAPETNTAYFNVSDAAPGVGDGRENDLHLNTTSKNVYIKSGGSWGVTGKVGLVASTLTYANPATIDFAGDDFKTISLTGNCVFQSSNLAAGRCISVRIVCDGSDRTLGFPADWTFVGPAAPADIAANKVGLLSVTSFGTTDTNVVAAYAVEE